MITHSTRIGYEKSKSTITNIKRFIAFYTGHLLNASKMIAQMDNEFVNNDKEPTSYVGIPWAWGGYAFEKKYFEELTEHEFEEHSFFIPKDYDFESHKELVPMQPGDVPVTYADTTPLEKDFGFNPFIGMELQRNMERAAFVAA